MSLMVEDVGFEPRFKLPKLACYHYTTSSILVLTAGFEPATSALSARCSTDWAMRAFLDYMKSLISYNHYIIFFLKNQIIFFDQDNFCDFSSLYQLSYSPIWRLAPPVVHLRHLARWIGWGGWIRTNDTRIWSQS